MRKKAEIPVGRKRRPRFNHHHSSQQSKRIRGSPPDAPCAQCILMFSHQGLEQLNSPSGFRHQTRTECIASGNKGCRICKFVFLVICKEYDTEWTENDCVIFRNFQSTHIKSTVSSIKVPGIYGLKGSLESAPDQCIIRIYPFAKDSDPLGAIVRRRPIHRDVQSDQVFAAARSLIKKCMDPKIPHKNCQYSRDTVLPTRVLDIGKLEDPHPTITLRVNETETHTPYLALSYCWGMQPKSTGREQPLLLRRDTLQDLAGSIRVESLQQSIQDAIFVTHRLGFRYLWVDALCIIQDCEIDKDKEISQMASIYKNAAITIAASSSNSATYRFLSMSIRTYCLSSRFYIPMVNGEKGIIYLSAEAYEPDHPLDKRGWALQEFMLSSRILIFSDYELLWQCKEVELQGVTGKGLEYIQPLEALPWTVFDDDAEPYFGSLDSDKVYLWKTIIQQYTERKLTDPEDRLRAIAGITSELETLWRDTNIYGLWKAWFIEFLAWYKPHVEREQERCLRRAPSWSWASLNGVICHEGPFYTQDAQVKSITISAVELTCRTLQEDDLDDEKLHTILERPDLINPCAEFRQGGLQYTKTEYLLLGTMKGVEGVEKGICLFVADVGTLVYRRLGLAIFTDMTLWKNGKLRDIILEPKLVG